MRWLKELPDHPVLVVLIFIVAVGSMSVFVMI